MENKDITFILYVVLMPVAFILFIWVIAKFAKVVLPLILKLEKTKKSEAFENGETTQYAPKFVNIDVAIYIARSCSNLYFLLAALTVISSLLGSIEYLKFNLITAGVLVISGIGVRAMSRSASIGGLVFYAAVKILTFNILGIVFLLLFLLFLFNGVKATFAYHKLKNETTDVVENTEEVAEPSV